MECWNGSYECSGKQQVCLCGHVISQYHANVWFRMEELSKPIIRDTMDSVQFNPDVFNVSEAAKKAKASARIEELAEPIKR